MPADGGGDTVMFASTPAHVMLVIDKSGSMHSNTWDHDGDHGTPEVTRWNTLHGVVADLVASYPMVEACGEEDGWRFTGESAPWDTIELCGGACDAFRSAGRLDTTYACMPVG